MNDLNHAITSTRKKLEDEMIAETEALRFEQAKLRGEYHSLVLLLRSGRNLAIGALVLTLVNTCLGIAGLVQ